MLRTTITILRVDSCTKVTFPHLMALETQLRYMFVFLIVCFHVSCNADFKSLQTVSKQVISSLSKCLSWNGSAAYLQNLDTFAAILTFMHL